MTDVRFETLITVVCLSADVKTIFLPKGRKVVNKVYLYTKYATLLLLVGFNFLPPLIKVVFFVAKNK